jgi:rhamnose transport system ATP-binding protein
MTATERDAVTTRPTDAAPEVSSVAPVSPALEIEHVSKRFAATQALEDVSLTLRPGEIHALVGENGAGKSTLVKIMAGVHQPDTGHIRLGGVPIEIRSPTFARDHGIAVIHQEPRLFPDMSVAENVFLGHQPKSRIGGIDWRTMRHETGRIFEALDVTIPVDTQVRGLSMADQQLVEIAKALSIDARVLIMDEPTASLSLHEVQRLFSIIRRTRDSGVAVMFVSHRLEEVFEISDSTTVFRDGRHVVTAPTSELTTTTLIRHMVGRAVTLFPKVETHPGEKLLEVRGLTRLGEFRDVSFSVHAGEIVGFAGLVGAGRTEIMRVLFGINPADAGEVLLDGKRVRFASPSAALSSGVAYVPEDRHQDGLVLDFPISSNVTLPILTRLFPRLRIRRATERAIASDYAGQLQVRMTGVDQMAASLSGGNQQKVVIAKWLASKPRILILDEPTRGIDIGAKVEVHRIIAELAASGLGIVLVSSELPEVLAMCDRILVMHEGTVTDEMTHAEATQERVMFAATGSEEETESVPPVATAADGGPAPADGPAQAPADEADGAAR